MGDRHRLIAVTAVLGLAVFAIGYLSRAGNDDLSSAISTQSVEAETEAQRHELPSESDTPASLAELLTLPPEELGELDIARVNLLCAEGLPGSEGIEIEQQLAQLDQWAEYARLETARHLYKFHHNPEEYENSEGYFRMLVLLTVLQQDLGVHYNLDRVREVDFRHSQDLFLHGLIGSDNGGTCVSMPVLYVAVGRRLGYPLRLVLAPQHVFCRWDSPQERFNIEGSGQGLNSYPDEYYLTWPREVTAEEAERCHYLASLTPAEELGCFLASRGHCLLDNGRTQKAHDAYSASSTLVPEDPTYLAWAEDTRRRLESLSMQQAQANVTTTIPTCVDEPRSFLPPTHLPSRPTLGLPESDHQFPSSLSADR